MKGYLKTGLALGIFLGLFSMNSYAEECSNCDFSDEPIVVNPVKKSVSEQPLKTVFKAQNLPSSEGVTTCNGVSSCNDFIALCVDSGGDFSSEKYDPDSGAPSAGSCTTPK